MTDWIRAKAPARLPARLTNLSLELNTPWMGAALLAAAFLFGLVTLYFGRFVDEADNLTVGWLISGGSVLYRDVFSHHFPLSYFWVAGVVSLVGNSFPLVRLSLVILQLVIFAILMRATRWYLVLGLVGLTWSLINQFHRGQELIYPSFEGLFILAAFTLVFWMLVQRQRVRRRLLLGTGLFLGLAVLTDPLMIYPAAVAWLAILVSGLQAVPGAGGRERLVEGVRRAVWTGGVAAGLVALFAVYLLATGAEDDFYASTIWFNAEIYTRYVDASPIRSVRIVDNLFSGLKIRDPRWYRAISPFYPLNPYGSVELENEAGYFSWIFSGFLYRISFLLCTLGLLVHRRATAAVFLYVFAATLLVRRNAGFYTIGFTLVSLFAAYYLITELARLPRRLAASPGGVVWLARLQAPAQLAWVGVLAGLALMQIWSGARGGFFLLDHWSLVTSARHVRVHEKLGDQVRQVTCDQPGVELSVFPNNPIVHFVTGLKPASRYTFMYPWVADVGQQDLIAELQDNPRAVVWINTNRKEGTAQSPEVYMAETLAFLRSSYIDLGSNIWMSPELAQQCPVTAASNPFDGE